MFRLSSIRPGKAALAAPKFFLNRYVHLNPIILDLERPNLRLQHYEICLSGDEDEVAHHKSSFDPSVTNLEAEFQTLEKECKAEGIIDPLLFSPANMTISLILKEIANEETDMEGEREKIGSVKGWTRKGKVVHIKDIPGGPFDRYEKLLEVLRKRASDYSTKNLKQS